MNELSSEVPIVATNEERRLGRPKPVMDDILGDVPVVPEEVPRFDPMELKD